jgi:hypothetical protein
MFYANEQNNRQVDRLLPREQSGNAMLRKHRAEIEKQLERMDRAIDVVEGARVARGGSTLKGTKVPPKYRGATRAVIP